MQMGITKTKTKMEQTIKEVALDYINSERENNFYAADRKVTLYVCEQELDVETIWYSKDEDKVYLHVGCNEFEGDLDIESLSEANQQRMREVFKWVYVSPEMVPMLMEQFKDETLIFLFRPADMEHRPDIRGLSREECFKRCANYYTLDDFDGAWNNTDDEECEMPDIKSTWCYVSQPEKKEPKPWEFDEQAFIEQYCPMAGGNDYLGWIDDICKLLDGEAEPGDAASTGDYADCSEEELRKELKRLTTIVLTQAVESYVEENY